MCSQVEVIAQYAADTAAYPCICFQIPHPSAQAYLSLCKYVYPFTTQVKLSYNDIMPCQQTMRNLLKHMLE